MAGVLALVGGDEFRPSCDEMDRALLARCAGRPVRVLILPTAAAAERPDLAAANGVAHFQRLNVEATPLMAVDRASANDRDLATKVVGASLVYVAGGDPNRLLETLHGSLVWEAIVEAYEAGMALAGSSAGAMVLAEWMRDRRGGWRKTLDLVSRVAVLPHHERADAGRRDRARAGLDEEAVLLGIDGATGCMQEDESWEVLGAGGVTLYFPGGSAVYWAGESFVL